MEIWTLDRVQGDDSGAIAPAVTPKGSGAAAWADRAKEKALPWERQSLLKLKPR